MRSVVVVGDAFLDVDIDGSTDRFVPDTIAPVVGEQHRVERAGGAGLAATLLARAHPDVDVTLVCCLADDADGRRLRDLLPAGVELIHLPVPGPTPAKIRVRSGGTTVMRLDRGGPSSPPRDVDARVGDALARADAVLVSDYGRGVAADERVTALLADAATRVPLVWDPHPRGGPPVPGAALVTPNRAEAAHALGRSPAGSASAAVDHADELVHRWSARAVVVTLGGQGAVVSHGHGAPAVVPAEDIRVTDACGAGDCFAAAAAAALAAGALPSEAVVAAVRAAGDFLAAGGVTAAPGRSSSPAGNGPATDAVQVVAAARAHGATVVATGGCFDLLHAGHVATLEAARRLGDVLVVCLNSDASVRRLKGPQRPVQSQDDRRRVLGALRAVDAVAIFDEDTPEAVLRELQPDVWVKGGDYAGRVLPETALVESWGGRTVTVPYLRGRSTTSIVAAARG